MKTQPKKKLTVRRATIRQLSTMEIAQARGGESEATCVTTKLAANTQLTCPPG